MIVATVHLLDLSGKFSEVPYLGVAYVILIVGSIVAMALLIRRDERGWWLGGALTLGTLVSFVLSRTTGLPGATDDIGNWSEPLGLWAVVAEAAMVALTAWMLARTRRSAA